MGRSLGGEDIVREKKMLLWVHKCYEEMLSRGVRTHEGIIETPDVRNQTNSANFTTGDGQGKSLKRRELDGMGGFEKCSLIYGPSRGFSSCRVFVQGKV